MTVRMTVTTTLLDAVIKGLSDRNRSVVSYRTGINRRTIDNIYNQLPGFRPYYKDVQTLARYLGIEDAVEDAVEVEDWVSSEAEDDD